MSIADPATSHPRLGLSQHHRSGSSSLSPPTKAVRFAPYATSAPSLSVAAHFRRSSSHSRSPSRSQSPQHLEVHVRSSKSPSPSALSSGTFSDSDMQDMDMDVEVDIGTRVTVERSTDNKRERSRSRSSAGSYSPSPTPRDSVSTVSECDSEVSGGAEVVAMHRLALSGRPTRPILKPTARRARPPAPLRPRRDHREHRRAHSFSSLATQINPATVGYMLCPSPRSATLGPSQRDLQGQALRENERAMQSPVRATYPAITVSRSAIIGLPSPVRAPAPIAAPHLGKSYNQQGPRSPRSPLASRPAGLDTISESSPAPVLAPHPSQVLPARRHSTYIASSTLPIHAPLHISRTPSPSNDPSPRPAPRGPEASGPQMSLERMMLVNPSIAAHLKRGGVVSVRSVDGKKSWKIRIPEEQLASMRMRA